MNSYDILARSTEKYGDKQALAMRFDSGAMESFSYRQVKERADAYCDALAAAGVVPGDRVAIIAGNCPQWSFCFFAITRLGACAVMLDCALPVQTISELIAEADVRAVLCSDKYLPAMTAFLIPVLDLHAGLAPFSGHAARVPDDYPKTPDPDPDAAVIVFSSGTTSSYKGVVHTHAGLYWAAENGGRQNGVLSKDRLLATLPLSHLYGLMAKLLSPLDCGAAICYIESNNAKTLLGAFQDFKPTAFCCVPRVFDMFRTKAMDMIDSKGKLASCVIRLLMRASGFLCRHFGITVGRLIFKQIHTYFGGECYRFMSGGAPLSAETEGFFFGIATPVYNNYALTEAGLPLIANRPSKFCVGTCGTPMPGVQMRIHEPDTRGIGEIRVKSPGAMKGYFRNPEATATALDKNGWLRTGDLGRITKHGDLVVTGRLKENIILPTGLSLSPDDVERLYGTIPGAAQFVVCGVPAGVGSYDEVHAFVLADAQVENAQHVAQDAIRRAGEHVPVAMRISQVHFVESMPRTTLEKPRRFLLRQQLVAAVPQETAAKPMPEIAEPVVRAIRSLRTLDKGIAPDTRVAEDLGFDSLSLTELCLRIEELTGKDISTHLEPNITVLELAEALCDVKQGEHALYGGRYRLEDFPKKRRLSDRLVFAGLSALLKTAWHFEVKGLANLPRSGSYLLCPNHQTDLDAIYILMHLSRATRARFCAMATMEHLDTAFRRHMFYMAGGIPVDRRVNPGPAYTRCREVMETGRVLLIHPEGTRTRDGSIGAFKKGAARLAIACGCSIVPVRITGGFEAFPNTRKLPKLTGRPKVTITFGAPIPPEGFDAEQLTESVRQAMLSL